MKYTHNESGGKVKVTLTGDITAGIESDLAKLKGQIKGGHVDFDCAGVQMINSVGIRHWRQFLKELSGRATVEFHRCPTYFVDYANMVPDLTEMGVIVSFYAPLRCPDCAKSQPVLLVSKDVDPEAGYGSHKCSKCGSELEPEVPAEDYLAFLDPLS